MLLCHVEPMRGMVWADGSLGTIAALLHHGVKSPHTVVCLLRVASRSTSYYRCPAVSISYTHLMLAICCVWLVLYTINVLPAPRAW
jgi:hypothetical protein